MGARGESPGPLAHYHEQRPERRAGHSGSQHGAWTALSSPMRHAGCRLFAEGSLGFAEAVSFAEGYRAPELDVDFQSMCDFDIVPKARHRESPIKIKAFE